MRELSLVVLLMFTLLVLCTSWSVIAQPSLTCEDALAKANAKIDLLVVVRDKADDAAAEAIAVVRKQRDKMQQDVKLLKEQIGKLQEALTGAEKKQETFPNSK